jgi:hypothetical protein
MVKLKKIEKNKKSKNLNFKSLPDTTTSKSIDSPSLTV